MQARAIITSKGQVTIPKPVREAAGLRASDLVEFEIRRGEVVLRPAGGRFLTRGGSVPPRRRPEDWRRIRRRVAADIARRVVGKRRG